MQQLSQQATEPGPAPQGHALKRLRRRRRVDKLIASGRTTPGRIRAIMTVLVLGILLSGGLGAYAADARAQAARDIKERIEPLNEAVTRLYQSLAAADAAVTSGFLSGGVEGDIQDRYVERIDEATALLARAGAQAGEDLVTANRVADITAQLPVYTGLVERARLNNRLGFPLGLAYLRSASELMQNSILPEALELQNTQAERLDDAYSRAVAVPVVALATCAVSLAGLVWAQLFLYRRTNRVFNLGLVTATGTVLVGLLWWTVTGVQSAEYLQGSRGHSQSASDALGPAQVAALEARAIESLTLVARDGGATENDFDTQMDLLARDGGSGGALGAARRLATDQEGRDLVAAAIDEAISYGAAHQNVRELDERGDYSLAVDAALSRDQISDRTTFDRLEVALTDAYNHEREEFQDDINRALEWLDWLVGLAAGIGALALAAAVGVVLGARGRLEEYR